MRHQTCLSPQVFFTDCSKLVLLFGSLLLFVFHGCHVVLSVPCSHVVNCLVLADLLALLFVIFSCVFVTFSSNSILGQVRYLIVSIPDLCLHFFTLLSFVSISKYQQFLHFKDNLLHESMK